MSLLLYFCFLLVITYKVGVCVGQRKVSLSALQSKAAKRRDDAQKQNKAPKKKQSAAQPVPSKLNGFTTNDKTKGDRTLIGEHLELEVMQVDPSKHKHKHVSQVFH